MAAKTHEKKLKEGMQCALEIRELRSSLQSVLTVLPSVSILKTLTAKQRGDVLVWAMARRKWERDTIGVRTAKPPKMPVPLMQLLQLMCDIPHGGQMQENKKLTPARRRSYLRRGSCCPYCRSESITGESVDIEGNQAYQEVSCQECCRTWRDIYRLDSVEEIET